MGGAGEQVQVGRVVLNDRIALWSAYVQCFTALTPHRLTASLSHLISSNLEKVTIIRKHPHPYQVSPVNHSGSSQSQASMISQMYEEEGG